MFKRTNDLSMANGASLQGHIQLPPKALVKAFGAPGSECGDDTIQGEYAFLSDDGKHVFTVYDWKVEGHSFWHCEENQTMNIGGTSKKGLEQFRSWLSGVAAGTINPTAKAKRGKVIKGEAPKVGAIVFAVGKKLTVTRVSEDGSRVWAKAAKGDEVEFTLRRDDTWVRRGVFGTDNRLRS